MSGELRNWIVISVVGVIWLTLVLVGLVAGDLHQLSVIADLVPLLLIAAALFERWGWRWKRLHPYLVQMPVVRGTWRGELESLWEDPETKTRPAKKVVYLAIEQTLTESVARLMSNESSSDQLVGVIRRRPGGRFFLSAIYQNTPLIDRREASPIHFGAMTLDIYGHPPSRLEGEYWTERPSKGKLVLSGHSLRLAESYEDAHKLDFPHEAPSPANPTD
jgi:uncharacterized membrane protein YbaN (DUF454 family)